MTAHRFFGYETLRGRWQKPEAVLADIGLTSGSTFMDIGCGDGFFAIPAAEIVGKRGKVYALDVNSWAIDRLKKKAMQEDLANLSVKVGVAEETVFCEACADFVFYSAVLHDFRDPAKVLVNAKRMLKPTGKLVDLDWKKKRMAFGPPVNIRFSEEKATDLMKSVGFKIEIVKEAGPYHYLIIARP